MGKWDTIRARTRCNRVGATLLAGSALLGGIAIAVGHAETLIKAFAQLLPKPSVTIEQFSLNKQQSFYEERQVAAAEVAANGFCAGRAYSPGPQFETLGLQDDRLLFWSLSHTGSTMLDAYGRLTELNSSQSDTVRRQTVSSVIEDGSLSSYLEEMPGKLRNDLTKLIVTTEADPTRAAIFQGLYPVVDVTLHNPSQVDRLLTAIDLVGQYCRFDGGDSGGGFSTIKPLDVSTRYVIDLSAMKSGSDERLKERLAAAFEGGDEYEKQIFREEENKLEYLHQELIPPLPIPAGAYVRLQFHLVSSNPDDHFFGAEWAFSGKLLFGSEAEISLPFVYMSGPH